LRILIYIPDKQRLGALTCRRRSATFEGRKRDSRLTSRHGGNSVNNGRMANANAWPAGGADGGTGGLPRRALACDLGYLGAASCRDDNPANHAMPARIGSKKSAPENGGYLLCSRPDERVAVDNRSFHSAPEDVVIRSAAYPRRARKVVRRVARGCAAPKRR
jgi:hypothetical protein